MVRGASPDNDRQPARMKSKISPCPTLSHSWDRPGSGDGSGRRQGTSLVSRACGGSDSCSCCVATARARAAEQPGVPRHRDARPAGREGRLRRRRRGRTVHRRHGDARERGQGRRAATRRRAADDRRRHGPELRRGAQGGAVPRARRRGAGQRAALRPRADAQRAAGRRATRSCAAASSGSRSPRTDLCGVEDRRSLRSQRAPRQDRDRRLVRRPSVRGLRRACSPGSPAGRASRPTRPGIPSMPLAVTRRRSRSRHHAGACRPALDVPLALADPTLYEEFTIPDTERIHFMVIDCRGVVQYVAPIAPNADDTDAVLDELFAAAEQAVAARDPVARRCPRRSRAYGGKRPVLGRGVFLAETCAVIGDVVIGDETSIWYGTVVRGDVMPIRIGARTSRAGQHRHPRHRRAIRDHDRQRLHDRARRDHPRVHRRGLLPDRDGRDHPRRRADRSRQPRGCRCARDARHRHPTRQPRDRLAGEGEAAGQRQGARSRSSTAPLHYVELARRYLAETD